MDNNSNFSQNMDAIFTELQDFVKTESMMGTPLKVEDKTLVPVVSVTLGYGSGAKKSSNSTSMAPDNSIGLGARVTTNAVVVVDKDTVSMLPVSEKSNMNQNINQLIDKIPQMVGGNKHESTQNQNQSQSQQDNHQMQQKNMSTSK